MRPEEMNIVNQSPFTGIALNQTKSSFGTKTQSDFDLKRLKLTLPPVPETCFICNQNLVQGNDNSKYINKTYSMQVKQLIYMPNQEQFLEELGRKVQIDNKFYLALGNRKLPPLVRMLFPDLNKIEDYIKIQRDIGWLEQNVYLNKRCYEAIVEQMFKLAKQAQRLNTVQTQFQKEILEIVNQNVKGKKKGRKGQAESQGPSVKRDRRDSLDRIIDMY